MTDQRTVAERSVMDLHAAVGHGVAVRHPIEDIAALTGEAAGQDRSGQGQRGRSDERNR